MTFRSIAMGMVLFAASCFAADVDGKWTGTMSTPNGDLPVNFTFKADGAKLDGSTMGPDGGEIKIQNGKVDGEKISFSVTFDFGGMPARNGVVAAAMVASGCTGVEDVFSGERNFFIAWDESGRIGRAPQPELLVRDLGSVYEIVNTNIKRWSVGSPIQAPLDALELLFKRRPFGADDVRKVTVRVAPAPAATRFRTNGRSGSGLYTAKRASRATLRATRPRHGTGILHPSAHITVGPVGRLALGCLRHAARATRERQDHGQMARKVAVEPLRHHGRF